MHANIQKDGTYSVVPRMWGGVTTPNELRAIADAADKYNADGEGDRRPAARPVRHQERGPARRLGRSERRRDGLGPRLWQGAAHGEDLRRLRMVPLRHAGFDRAGHQDRKDDLGFWMPHKFKIAVSGCPRNCAEATSRTSAWSASIAATSFTSAAMAASRCAAPTCCARSPPRRRRWNIARAFIQLYREQAAIWNAPRRGSSASASIM
jgi:nitrite reductase (NADH) large subunit